MGLIEMASGNSVWCGMDYYERKMVCSWKKSGEETYDGVVSGSEGNKYSVHIDKMHPRKSSCNCPFAEGNKKVCKHKLQYIFLHFPKKPRNITKVSKAMMNPSLTMIMTMIILMKMMNLTEISERLSAIF